MMCFCLSGLPYGYGNEEEVPQRRRSTTSTRREWTLVAVAEDVENVDDAADEIHDSVTDHVGIDIKGFLGGS